MTNNYQPSAIGDLPSAVRRPPSELRWLVVVVALILALAVALNVVGYLVAPPDHRFMGLVYAQEDGQTYLAKIRQGMRGEWLYTLAFSAEPGPPFFVFANYLSLGHVGAWLNLEPIVMFHVARLIDGAILLVTLYAFIGRFITDVRERRFAFLLATAGGGFGWLALLLGHPTADILQPEMFPFLSILANVHFSLAMAAMLWLLDSLVVATSTLTIPYCAGEGHVWGLEWARLIVGTLILAMTAAYGLITICSVAGLWIAVRWWRTRRMPRATIVRLAVVVLLAAPFALYYRWAFLTNPSYVGWDRQNITLSPPVWDYLVAGGVVLGLAVVGYALIIRHGLSGIADDANHFLLVVWPLVTSALIFAPLIVQQRRFATGLFVPVAILAVKGLSHILRLNTRRARSAVLAMSCLTNLLLFVITYGALMQHIPSLFVTSREWHGIAYLRAQADPAAVVLASPELSNFIPAWAEQRVVYGHPVETLDAKVRRDEVKQFFAGTLPDVNLWLKPVDYIVVGPRERALGSPSIPSSFQNVFADGDMVIYKRVNR